MKTPFRFFGAAARCAHGAVGIAASAYAYLDRRTSKCSVAPRPRGRLCLRWSAAIINPADCCGRGRQGRSRWRRRPRRRASKGAHRSSQRYVELVSSSLLHPSSRSSSRLVAVSAVMVSREALQGARRIQASLTGSLLMTNTPETASTWTSAVRRRSHQGDKASDWPCRMSSTYTNRTTFGGSPAGKSLSDRVANLALARATAHSQSCRASEAARSRPSIPSQRSIRR